MANVNKVTLMSVLVRRGGKTIRVPPNTSFDFTREEADDILKSFPGGLRDPVRDQNIVVSHIKPDPEPTSDTTGATGASGPVSGASGPAAPGASGPAARGSRRAGASGASGASGPATDPEDDDEL